jgi:hypothetical protein
MLRRSPSAIFEPAGGSLSVSYLPVERHQIVHLASSDCHGEIVSSNRDGGAVGRQFHHATAALTREHECAYAHAELKAAALDPRPIDKDLDEAACL